MKAIGIMRYFEHLPDRTREWLSNSGETSVSIFCFSGRANTFERAVTSEV